MADKPSIPEGFVSGNDLKRRRPPRRDRVDAIKREVLLEHGLDLLREMTGTPQTTIAERMETSRQNVSRIEGEADIRLSTLERYVRAVGGKLEVVARLPDGEHVTLVGSDDPPNPKPGRPRMGRPATPLKPTKRIRSS